MNPSRNLYARMTLNGERKSLGCAPMNEIVTRLTSQYLKHKYDGNKLQLIVEISYDELPAESIMSREQQLESELASHMITDPAEELFPGVTVARMQQVIETELFEQYKHICEPSNRIGLDQSIIDDIRSRYRDEYPDCVAHFPLWRDS